MSLLRCRVVNESHFASQVTNHFLKSQVVFCTTLLTMYWWVTLAITCWYNIYYMLVSLYIDDQWISIISCGKVTRHLPLKVSLSLVTSRFLQVKLKTEVILSKSKSSQWLRIESKSYVSLSPFYLPSFLTHIQSTHPSSLSSNPPFPLHPLPPCLHPSYLSSLPIHHTLFLISFVQRTCF